MADAIPLNRPSKARAGAVASADERLAFERLLVDLSSQFANVAGDQFEIVTQTALSRILEFLGFDRSTFGEFLENGSIDVLASSAIEGVVHAIRKPLVGLCLVPPQTPRWRDDRSSIPAR